MTMIKAIQRLSNQLPLSTHYTWDGTGGAPITIPATLTGAFERNIYLKQNLGGSLTSNSWKAFFWIIQDWGGIKSFKDNPRNRGRIESFFVQLAAGKLTRESHGLLPSLSKLAAFRTPGECAIYDSRAVYALNWLLFCNEKDPVLFPQPPSRNKTLMDMDTQTLFRLSGRPYTVRSCKTAYPEYCKLLKELSSHALGMEPFYLEMLLFVAAKEWVPADIRRRTTVTIKTDTLRHATCSTP